MLRKITSSIFFRVLLFAALFICLQLGWDALRDTAVEFAVIHSITVCPAAWLINRLTPAVQAMAVNFSILSADGGLNILNGCEGLEAFFMLLAAFAVAPLTKRSRAIGMLLGIMVVFVINQARILLLFYAYRADPAWFDVLHATVTPIGVVLLVAAYFYFWLHGSRRVQSG